VGGLGLGLIPQYKSDLLANWSNNLNEGGKIILPVAGLSLN
jgi:hypothetical protein